MLRTIQIGEVMIIKEIIHGKWSRFLVYNLYIYLPAIKRKAVYLKNC